MDTNLINRLYASCNEIELQLSKLADGDKSERKECINIIERLQRISTEALELLYSHTATYLETKSGTHDLVREQHSEEVIVSKEDFINASTAPTMVDAETLCDEEREQKPATQQPTCLTEPPHYIDPEVEQEEPASADESPEEPTMFQEKEQTCTDTPLTSHSSVMNDTSETPSPTDEKKTSVTRAYMVHCETPPSTKTPTTDVFELKRLVPIMDYYRFFKELFGNDAEKIKTAMELISNETDYEKCAEMLTENYHWNPKKPETKEFLQVVEKYYKRKSVL